MKNIIGILVIFVVSFLVFSCSQESELADIESTLSAESTVSEITELTLSNLSSEISLQSGRSEAPIQSQTVIEELVKSETCNEIISGVIELYDENNMVYTLDFGNGECDAQATLTWTDENNELQTKVIDFKRLSQTTKPKLKKDCPNPDKPKRKPCFKLVLPVSYQMPDGSTVTVEDEDDFGKLRAWHQANPEVKERPKLQFPVTISFGEGQEKVINSSEEFREIEANCKGNKDDKPNDSKGDKEKKAPKKPCFKLVFPVSYQMPDGSTVTVENEDDFGKLKAWHQANPEVRERPKLQFPITISFDEGQEKVINSVEEFRSAETNCQGEDEKPQ